MDHQNEKSINHIIELAIQIAGGTQASLAKKSGLSQNAIWKLLHKRANCRYETAKKLERGVDGAISSISFVSGEISEDERAGGVLPKKNRKEVLSAAD